MGLILPILIRACAKTPSRKREKAAFAAFSRVRPADSGRGRFGVGLLAVLLAEFFHASRGVHDLLLASIKRMAGGADFHVQRFAQRGARSEGVSAAAGDRNVGVLGMDFRLHFGSFHVEAGFALPKGADYPQVGGDWQPRL